MGQLACPLAAVQDGCTCTQAVWMTKGLASFLSLAYHTSQGLGQAMCGLSTKWHSGTEGS